MAHQHCDLQIHINGQHTFFLNERTISAYSGRLRKIIKQERRRTQIKTSGIEVDDYPGGQEGFELVSRFCYNGGQIPITVANVSILHCSAVFLAMTEKVSPCNLLHQTNTFLDGIFEWSWPDLIVCLKSCEPFLCYADSIGLATKLICALMAKIAQNSDINLIASSSSGSSSPETTSGFRFSSSSKTTPELTKQVSFAKSWWFDDLTVLSPAIIERLVKSLGAFRADNNSIVLTKFLLNYLKSACRSQIRMNPESATGIADTAVYGAFAAGKSAFSCRGLFRVLRTVSGFGISKDCRSGLERLIGETLDQASLDDVLVSGRDRGVYDVNLVVRLIRVFVNGEGAALLQKLKKVGRLVDKYLREIAPDQNLKMSRFLGVAESLPDSARDCFDGVYRAVDIFLESHPSLSFEERSRLCRCLNYEKLSLESCKELAKNPKIPPRIAMQALMSQSQSQYPKLDDDQYHHQVITPYESPVNSVPSTSDNNDHGKMVVYSTGILTDTESTAEENEEMKMNLQRMQWRVVELEKVCKDMKVQMSKMVRASSASSATAAARALPRLC